MHDFIINQSPIIFYLLLCIFTIIIGFLSYKVGTGVSYLINSKSIKEMEKEKKNFL